jgi:predicted metal-dependent hydrolase
VAGLIPAAGLSLDLGDRTVPVTVRRSAAARRTSIRVDAVRGVVLVLPSKASLAEARRFLASHAVWVAERLARLPAARPLVPGAEIPVLGIAHPIRHCPQARRGVWIEDGAICVSGLAEQVGRRVTAFLKQHARRLIADRAVVLAARLGRSPGRITIRDTRSRWGSCSSAGDLSFSWRLVLAPDWVLTYVVAHELAHLVEMNHSPAFWAVVAGLSPDAARARTWLKRHGAGLHRVGECATD